jgi:hypothetical protein
MLCIDRMKRKLFFLEILKGFASPEDCLHLINRPSSHLDHTQEQTTKFSQSVYLAIPMYKTYPKSKVVNISYTQQEAPKILAMEEHLMNHFGFTRSQLHRQLVRDKYQTLTTE